MFLSQSRVHCAVFVLRGRNIFGPHNCTYNHTHRSAPNCIVIYCSRQKRVDVTKQCVSAKPPSCKLQKSRADANMCKSCRQAHVTLKLIYRLEKLEIACVRCGHMQMYVHGFFYQYYILCACHACASNLILRDRYKR